MKFHFTTWYQEERNRRKETVLEQARTLSSGTIASISGQTQYAVIDRVQQNFMAFCIQFGSRYTTWQEAWSVYYQTGRMSQAIAKEVIGNDYPT